eukprot:TRINITY_DN306_c1_g1_i1.p1 TRINITY_DN306_c1_g1~~TRINITY_DN306_c1_g1_i1.p1  ORF type:complete len:704 (+),score=67.03 TRINITY_DN306_c1_g1_i1:144-2114(+)
MVENFEAPVFYPTEEEFKDPISYIEIVRQTAEQFGMCRIVPPKSWPFSPDTARCNLGKFSFITKSQPVHLLNNRMPPALAFHCHLKKYHQKFRTPVISGVPVDLYALACAVRDFGGFVAVEEANLWAEVACIIHLPKSARVSKILGNAYSTLIRPYLTQYPDALNPVFLSEPHLVADAQRKELEENFGYDQGETYNLDSFKNMADAFHARWFQVPPAKSTPQKSWSFYIGDHACAWVKPIRNRLGKPQLRQMARTAGLDEEIKHTDRAVEEEYWRIVCRGMNLADVSYGSDLDSCNGSGFPKDDPGGSLWNLNFLPKQPNCLVSHFDIGGVTRPFIYVGMLFSSFCWHTEDNYLASINFIHEGAAKSWWAVPATGSAKLEAAMRHEVPELFAARSDLLYLLVTQVHPKRLRALGVPVYHTIHRQGEFVVTFEKCYHAGFNHGFNIAEAVNLATMSWLTHGPEAAATYRTVPRTPVFSHEEFIWTALTSALPESTQRKCWLQTLSAQTFLSTIKAALQGLLLENESCICELERDGMRSTEMLKEHEVHFSQATPDDVWVPMRSSTSGRNYKGNKRGRKRKRKGEQEYMSFPAPPEGEDEGDGLVCEQCKIRCFASAVVCESCCQVLCIQHAKSGCGCDTPKPLILRRVVPPSLRVLL